MFHIPDFDLMPDMTFDEAVNIMKGRGKGSLLDGLMSMDRLWSDYIASDDQYDDEFYSNWRYEVNAYNIVAKKMRPLFV